VRTVQDEQAVMLLSRGIESTGLENQVLAQLIIFWPREPHRVASDRWPEYQYLYFSIRFAAARL